VNNHEAVRKAKSTLGDSVEKRPNFSEFLSLRQMGVEKIKALKAVAWIGAFDEAWLDSATF